MATVVFVVAGILATALLIMVVSYFLSRRVVRKHAAKATEAMGPPGPRDYEEPAVGLTPPYTAYGALRLTPGELVFSGGSKNGVLRIPLDSIVGATASRDVPVGSGMKTYAQNALVLQISDPTIADGLGFAVGNAAQWVERLRG